MNILYLADPNSIHDIKWISAFTKKYSCWIIYRTGHFNNNLTSKLDIIDAGTIDDFSLPRCYRTYKSIEKIRKIIKANKIDVFHILFAEPNALWAIIKNQLDVKMILTTRGTDVLKTIPDHFKKRNIINLYVKYLYKKAFNNFDKIISTSRQQKNSISHYLNYPLEEIEIIRTGINITALQTDTSSFLPVELNNRKYILFPRNMRAVYNHEFELEAISKLPDIIKGNYSFVFIDRNGPDHRYIQKIKDLMNSIPGISIIFMAKQSQKALYEMYKKASLVVMTPKSDGSPVTAMEAMFCKAPVIVGPLDYDKEIFGEWIFKLKKWDSYDLTKLIIKALGKTDPKKLDTAKKVVEKYCNSITEMEKVESIYLKFISH